MEKPILGVVDINGTIHSDSNGISEQVRAGFNSIHASEIKTTIATGRGLERAKQLLGPDWCNIVSDDLPLITENGGRLVTQRGLNLRFHSVSSETIDHTLDVLDDNLDEIRFVSYYPKSPGQGAVLWTASDIPSAKTEFVKRHGEPEVINKSTLSDLARTIREDDPCMLIVNFNTQGLESEFSQVNTVVNGPELNILEEGISKGRGVEDISEVLDIPLIDIFVAGNDYNDISMLSLPLRWKFLIGDTVTDSLPNVTKLDTPESFGQYIGNNF